MKEEVVLFVGGSFFLLQKFKHVDEGGREYWIFQIKPKIGVLYTERITRLFTRITPTLQFVRYTKNSQPALVFTLLFMLLRSRILFVVALWLLLSITRDASIRYRLLDGNSERFQYICHGMNLSDPNDFERSLNMEICHTLNVILQGL